MMTTQQSNILYCQSQEATIRTNIFYVVLQRSHNKYIFDVTRSDDAQPLQDASDNCKGNTWPMHQSNIFYAVDCGDDGNKPTLRHCIARSNNNDG
jgi:hypothetical protein